MATDTYKKLVLVTGGAGFVGSHLCERLVYEGYRVISLDNYFTGSPENHVEGVDYRTGHTKDIASLVSERPDLVFHLGEYARTEKSFEDIVFVFDLNTQGTYAVLEFCRRTGAKLVYAGSSTKFADQGSGRNQSPYAWTKAVNTELVVNYGTWFGLSYAITYFYNVYGPRERSGSYGTLIQIFADLYRQGQPLTITSPGTQTRNFTHVYDIVSGLIMVGERGQGDGYGIGADQMYSVREVASFFGGEVILLPERMGNRMHGGVSNEQVKALGWRQTKLLPDYIHELKQTALAVAPLSQRVLIFSTTFYPHNGYAEDALCDLIRAMPSIHFDVVTTKFAPATMGDACPFSNVTLHRVGYGHRFDKFLLPFFGAQVGARLLREHTYLFKWALFASYGALAALWTGNRNTPLLITLADQRLGAIPRYLHGILRMALGAADQVFAEGAEETKHAISIARRATLIRSIGHGNAFANQVRFAYSGFLRHRMKP